MIERQDVSERTLDEIDIEQFCFFPFMQLLLQPTGFVSACCWNQEVVLGKMPEQKISEIWNGEPMRALRREFLSGKPRACAQQMRHIGCHRFTRRPERELARLELAEMQSAGPKRLDLRLNGQCNLECVMCDVWKQPNGLYDEADLWTIGPREIFPYLREVDMLGGEPFVQADTYRLIDAVFATNPECSWAFVTNGQYNFNRAIRDRLARIPIRWMQVSLDSLDPDTYAKIRRKGTLARSLATLDELRRLRAQRFIEGREFKLHVSMCVQQENWREVGDFLGFARERKLITDLQFAYAPAGVSLLALTESERRDIAQFFSEVGKIHGADSVAPILLPLQESFA